MTGETGRGYRQSSSILDGHDVDQTEDLAEKLVCYAAIFCQRMDPVIWNVLGEAELVAACDFAECNLVHVSL